MVFTKEAKTHGFFAHQAAAYCSACIMSSTIDIFLELLENINMPELSRFLGIIITMYFNDHSPPHFHVLYNEYDAEIEINNLTVLNGKLPARVLGIAMEWAELHKEELMDNWNLLQSGKKYNKIQPLI